MTNIISEVNNFVKNNLDLYVSTIYQDVFPNIGSEELICRAEPSNGSDVVYMDKSRDVIFNFSYLAKSLNKLTVENELTKIVNLLSLEEMQISQGMTVTTINTQYPAFVSKTESKEWLYTASMQLRINIKK